MAYISTPPKNETGGQTVYPPPGAPGTNVERTVAEDARTEKTTTEVMLGGSSVEAIGGGAAVVLAILGLAGYLPVYMAAICTIAIGGALLAHGGAAAARWRDTLRRLDRGRFQETEVAGGIGTEVFGGAAGIVLGILALANMMPNVLLPVAAIVFGGSLLFGGAAAPQLSALATEEDRRSMRIARDAIEASSGVMVLVGVGAAVLGILALIKVGPAMGLAMVAMLAIGGALLLTGSAMTATFARRLQHIS